MVERPVYFMVAGRQRESVTGWYHHDSIRAHFQWPNFFQLGFDSSSVHSFPIAPWQPLSFQHMPIGGIWDQIRAVSKRDYEDDEKIWVMPKNVISINMLLKCDSEQDYMNALLYVMTTSHNSSNFFPLTTWGEQKYVFMVSRYLSGDQHSPVPHSRWLKCKAWRPLVQFFLSWKLLPLK